MLAKTFAYPGIPPEEFEQQCVDIVLHNQDWAEFYWADLPPLLRLLFVVANPEHTARYSESLPDQQRKSFLELVPGTDADIESMVRTVIHHYVFPHEFEGST
jgi:hypothetical protein